jgi:hypothetical protein
MRKKIAGCMVAAMAATVMLAGCGKESVTEENIKEDIIEESASEEPKEEAAGEEVKETSEDIQEASIVIAQHPLSCSIKGKERATGNYPEIILSDELKGKYPKLADYVGLLNENWANYTKEHVANYAVWAQESLDYYDDPVFVCEESAWIGRIDERLVTILTGYYEDSGGAHPNHGSSSINVDPVT